jgi:type I restriction enzyme S subunit
MKMVKLGEINNYVGKNINPLSAPEEVFEMYSVPSFNNKYPEIIKGEDIGSSKQLVQKNDVLICKINPRINRVWIVSEFTENKPIASSEWIVVRNKDMYPRYLMWYFRSDYFRSLMVSNITGMGGSLMRAQPNQVKEYLVPIMDYDNQIRIAEVLDKAQELIDKRKEQIEELDKLVKSRFIGMFGNLIRNSKGWEVKLLGEVCDMKAGKNIKACDISEINTGTLYPCYGGNGLRGYVKEYSHEGNIPLIGRQGALCGNVKYAQGKFYATEHAVVVQSKVEMNTYWLYYLLSELDLNRLSTGAAQPGLTVGKLNLVEIPIAPLDMQNEFEKLANQVDKLKFEMESSLKELENNFNSLMQKAFKGELFN